MEKMMKKNNQNNNIDIDDVEKILIKNLENKKEKKNNYNKSNEFNSEKTLNIDDFSKEIVDFNKSLPEDNPIMFHFDRKFVKENIDLISTFNSNKYSQFKYNLKLYNQKIGEYNYAYFDINKSNKTITDRSNNQTSNYIKLEKNFFKPRK